MNGRKPLKLLFGVVVLALAYCEAAAGEQEGRAPGPADSVQAGQVVKVPAAAPPGELQCPPRPRKDRRHRHRHNEAIYEPPDAEDIAVLPEQGQAQPQEITLNGRGKPGDSRPPAIAIWGDSHTASNFFSEEMTRTLGFALDRVQPTFIPPDMDKPGMRLPIRKHCQGEGWAYEYAYVSRQINGAFARGLVNLRSDVPGSYLWVDFRAHTQAPSLRSLDILFVPPSKGEKTLIGLVVDDGAEQTIELDQGGQGILHLYGEQPLSTIKLRLIEGTLALQGFAPEYMEKPDLYFDTLSIPGATVLGWKALDADYLRTRGGAVAYDLVIVEYGTNEGNDRGFNQGKYKADLRASLQNLRRAYPEAACVLIGPPDRGVLVKRKHGRGKNARRAKAAPANILKYAKIHRLIGDIQHAVGEEYACSYWSWQDAMGGPGAAYRWLRHSPALMGHDITHLTVAGLQISARQFVSDARLSQYLRNETGPHQPAAAQPAP
jgi:lysophospholipase L1-like esterase